MGIFFGLGQDAMADSVTVNMNVSPATDAESWDWDLSFPQFNGSLGTLNQVVINLTAQIQDIFTVTNSARRGSSSTSGTVSSQTDIFVNDDGSGGPELDSKGNLVLVNGNLVMLGGTPVVSWLSSLKVINVVGTAYVVTGLAPQAFVTSSPVLSTGSGVTSIIDLAELANFIGPGVLSLSAAEYGSTSIALTGGNASVVDSSSVDPSGTVTYEYTDATPGAVPLPGVAQTVMAGLIVVGIIGVIRKRFQIRFGA